MRISDITVFITAILLTNTAFSQVWTLDKNELYVNLSYSSTEYKDAFDSTGEIVSLPVEVSDKTIQFFAQYGLTDKLTLQLKLPYKLLSSEGDLGVFNSMEGHYLEAGELQYFGNIEVGALYKIIDDKPMVSVSLFVESNTMDYNYFTGLQTGLNSFGIKPGAGVAWAYKNTWLQYYLGGDIRTNNYSSAIVSNIEFGYKPVPYIYIAADMYVNRSLKNGEDCDCTNQYTALYLDQQEYFAYAIKAGFTIQDWGVNIAYNSTFTASNLPAAGIPTVGIQYKNIFHRKQMSENTLVTPKF